MKIMIYILFFCVFLVLLFLLFGVLMRSAAFLISSFRCFINKFPAKEDKNNDVVIGEQGIVKKLNIPVEMESVEIKEVVENDTETISE